MLWGEVGGAAKPRRAIRGPSDDIQLIPAGLTQSVDPGYLPHDHWGAGQGFPNIGQPVGAAPEVRWVAVVLDRWKCEQWPCTRPGHHRYPLLYPRAPESSLEHTSLVVPT